MSEGDGQAGRLRVEDVSATPTHPLEEHAIELAVRHLNATQPARGWPKQRIPVRILFEPLWDVGCKHTLRLDPNAVPLRGRLTLTFNPVFLLQNEEAFCRHLIPHEVAHVATEAEAAAKGRRVSAHGEEWQGWLARLSPETPQTVRPERDLGGFDGRAVALLKGRVALTCECEGRVEVHPRDKAEKLIGTHCTNCGAAYRQGERNTMPPEIQRVYEYVVDEKRRGHGR